MRLRIFLPGLLACFIGMPVSGAVRESFDLQVPMPPAPVRENGAQRLAYELHLTNFSDTPLRVLRAEVRDAEVRGAERDAVLAMFEADALQARIAQTGPADAADAAGTIAPGRRGVLYVDLDLPADAAPPPSLVHRIDYATSGSDARASVDGGPVRLSGARPPRLGPPLRGGPWAAIHHPDWPRGHRRVLYTVDGRARIPGRFAIDWVRLDADGRSTRGDADRAADALGYGAEVLAVDDAVVARVRDDMTESTSVSAHPRHALGDATGNYVALDLGDGRHAFYEHLKPGSIRVVPGQRVRRGEVIAALGFTGDSSGPHLHFHVSDAASPLGAEGLPFVFERFDVLGRYADLSRLGKAPWDPLESGLPVRREMERPAANVVVDFGD